jgi:hypothetical protein
MGLFILVIFFSFLINYVYFINDETLLLSFYFFLFFLIIYMFFKDKFKIFNILKILRKYNLFLTLFKVNFNYNKLLNYFLLIGKKLFNKFIIKLNFYKYIINIILASIFNKYKILVNILYLFFFNNINYIKKSLILYFFYLINKINLNDNLLYN